MADDICIGTKNTTEQHEALQKCFTRLQGQRHVCKMA